MKPSHQTMMHLYEHLGKVFYCIAATDKTIREEEIEQLKEIVKTEWLPFENTFNEFGDDTAYEIEIIFDWFRDSNIATSFSGKNKSERVFLSQLNTILSQQD